MVWVPWHFSANATENPQRSGSHQIYLTTILLAVLKARSSTPSGQLRLWGNRDQRAWREALRSPDRTLNAGVTLPDKFHFLARAHRPCALTHARGPAGFSLALQPCAPWGWWLGWWSRPGPSPCTSTTTAPAPPAAAARPLPTAASRPPSTTPTTRSSPAPSRAPPSASRPATTPSVFSSFPTSTSSGAAPPAPPSTPPARDAAPSSWSPTRRLTIDHASTF